MSVNRPPMPGSYTLTVPILTERLAIRAYTMDDVPFIHDLKSRPDVVRWLYEDVESESEVVTRVTRRMTQTRLLQPGDGLGLLVETRADHRPVGTVTLEWHRSPHMQGEVGYIVHPDHQGRGYAVEAAREMLRIGFEAVALHRIVGRLEARNQASARVLERLHMRFEGHFRENEWVKDEWQDEIVYAMLALEWEALKA
jgi:RimJ/RimL family protein N-acetyltransferase